MPDPQETQKPDWLKAWEAAPPPQPKRLGNPAWIKNGPSPNPAGRPPGSAQTKLMQRMLENADGIVDALLEKALEGDTSAISLVMARIIPSLRAQSEKVAFPFDATAPVSVQVEMVLAAISSGALAPDTGKQIIEAISALQKIRDFEQLVAQVKVIEQRQI